MAKLCMLEREKKRLAISEKWKRKRQEIKKELKRSGLSVEECMGIATRLSSLPRDSSPCRLRNRCLVTGRSRGFYRRFGLGRNKLREYAMLGYIPGLTKSSW